MKSEEEITERYNKLKKVCENKYASASELDWGAFSILKWVLEKP